MSSGDSPSAGNDAFAGRLLVIDFKRQRVAVVNDRTDLGPAFVNMSWVPMRPDVPGYVVISVTFGGETLANVMYDSGSSMSGISLHREAWEIATAPRDPNTGMSIVAGTSWGESISAKCAQSKKELTIGHARYEGLRACTIVDGDERRMIMGGLDATLGNQAFDLTGTIVIDYKDHLFGVLQN